MVQYAPSEGFSKHPRFSFMEGQHMSRVATPPSAQPANPQFKIPHDKIAMRAYEKWVKRGQPHGTSMQDWLEAEAELRAEYARNSGGPASMGRR
jgi:hypothetical protein